MGHHARASSAALLVALGALGCPFPGRAADLAAGKAVFHTECAVCHSIAPGRNGVGPTLFGIVGRKTGSVPGFAYSDANRNANVTWTETALNAYLKDPQTVLPGTSMGYGGLADDSQRADLVAYLATLK